MKNVSLLAALALGLAAGIVAARAGAQEGEGGEGVPDHDPEMMAKAMELATPGPEHDALAELAGKWEQRYEMRWSPDQPWQESSGTSVARTVLGGRYLLEEIDMEIPGMPMPMQGMHLLGYDNMAEEHLSLWADSMSTWWVTARGKEQPDGSIEYEGTMKDFTGERPHRMVVRHAGEDRIEMEMFDTIPPHGEVLVMKIVSTRAD